MTNTLARIKQTGKNFEIVVNLEDALKFKKGEISSIEPEEDRVFTDSKKGNVASQEDLQKAFGTTDLTAIVIRIIKNGEIQLTQEYRDEARSAKFKQVVDFFVTNSVDPQTGNPHTPERIRSALDQAGVNIKEGPIDRQIGDIVEVLSKIIPIKIEMKKVRLTIPAIHTGQAYGIVSQYKEEEKWRDNGDLEIIVKVPAGIVMDFYDKLNSVTHGSALSEEIEE
ncbi:MAG: ribosome assembly factor SBDS [Nanoarchaeota archaeon]|nr:ribosome assembly factor SBDS [Nanoarchaeota archaeon]